MVTNKEMNDFREPACLAVMVEKKYIRSGNMFIKRSLRRQEWQSTSNGILLMPPTTVAQRFANEAACLRYLSTHTTIPTPRLLGAFEDDGAYVLCTEFVDGVSMDELDEQTQKVVREELQRHVAVLRSLRSDTAGMPGEVLLCPPYRVSAQWKMNSCWRARPTPDGGNYVFCHNDLKPCNVLVDPGTFKIKAILDWEFGGFWPAWFELPFWKGDVSEEGDVERCRQWLLDNCDEVAMPQLDSVADKARKSHRKGDCGPIKSIASTQQNT